MRDQLCTIRPALSDYSRLTARSHAVHYAESAMAVRSEPLRKNAASRCPRASEITHHERGHAAVRSSSNSIVASSLGGASRAPFFVPLG